MATSKSGGSTSNGRDSHSKRLGCKRFAGQRVNCGEILVRQRGTKIHPGRGVRRSKDDTLHAQVSGLVRFYKGFRHRTFVSVIPEQE